MTLHFPTSLQTCCFVLLYSPPSPRLPCLCQTCCQTLCSSLLPDCALPILLGCTKARSEEPSFSSAWVLSWYQRQRLRQALLEASQGEKKAAVEAGWV